MPEPTPNSPAAEAAWQLPHTPRSAPRARELLRTQLTDWKIEAEVAETAELLLSELFTNSLRHASTRQAARSASGSPRTTDACA